MEPSERTNLVLSTEEGLRVALIGIIQQYTIDEDEVEMLREAVLALLVRRWATSRGGPEALERLIRAALK